MTNIQNPFLVDSPITLIGTLPRRYYINGYKNYMDVSYLFDETEEVYEYECEKSGFRFFYPFEIAGDSHFYETLQEHDWYYMPWKWENDYCQKYIAEGNRILDVGCGQGSFLKKIALDNDSLTCVGLELNETSEYREGNVEVLNETIEGYSQINQAQFDMVCSFQVLEHIPKVYSFLEGKVRALKKDGYLIIAVPNNDSDFLKCQEGAYLNMPPHHMGKWNENSLSAIANLFDLRIIEIVNEPLQEQHYLPYWYGSLSKKRGGLWAKICMNFIEKFGLTSRVKNKIAKKAHEITGHTILAVYQKN